MENYNYEKNNTYEVSLTDILKVFKRSILKILAVAAACGIIAFTFFNFVVPKTYTAKLKFYVESNASGDSIANYNYATALVNTYVQMLSTDSFYDKLSSNLDEKYSSKELSKMVAFSSGGDTRTEVFSASISGKTPMEAKTIADAVADIAPVVAASYKSGNVTVNVVDSAAVPTSPSSPNVMKNTLIAFGAGAAIMIIIIFIKEAVDNKIRYSSDSTEIKGIPILSAVPDFGSEKFILSAVPETEPVESEA